MHPRHGIIHIIPHPVAAKRFVEPLVQALIDDNREAELWVQSVPGLEPFLHSIAVPVHICPSNIGPNPLKVISNLVTLITRLHKRRPLVIYAHLLRGAFLPLIASFLCRVPIRIYHNHGAPYIGYRGPLRTILKTIEWINCHLATHIVTDSSGMRPALEAVAPAGMPIETYEPGSPCGLAPSEYAGALDPIRRAEARRRLGLQGDQLVFAYIGRPYKRKGFHILLDAFSRVFPNRQDVKLLVCGCTAADVAAAEPHAAPGIHPLGYLEDLMPIYQASDAVLLPSYHEGFGNCLLEGAAQGCALLASRIPGPNILIAEGQNGFLVTAEDVENLMEALRKMDQNRDWLRAMGAAAYQKSLEFRREIVVGHYLEFMHRVLAEDLPFYSGDLGGRLAA